MNELLARLELQSWKPVLAALALPPVPLLLLVLAGTLLLLRRRRGAGWLLVALGLAGLWLGATRVGADALQRAFLDDLPPALGRAQLEALRREPGARAGGAIVVLGGGVRAFAPEYGASTLSDYSLQRLRYGIWLARETGWPIAFSGGAGWATAGGALEADTAARIAAHEFGHPLRWTENRSRDTRENAARTVELLARDGVRHVLLVTHAWHMPRALRAFREAAGPGMRIEAAPMDVPQDAPRTVLDWLPSVGGFTRVQQLLHEVAGRAAGA